MGVGGARERARERERERERASYLVSVEDEPLLDVGQDSVEHGAPVGVADGLKVLGGHGVELLWPDGSQGKLEDVAGGSDDVRGPSGDGLGPVLLGDDGVRRDASPPVDVAPRPPSPSLPP